MSEIILPEENLSSDVLENKDAVVAEPVAVETETAAEAGTEEGAFAPAQRLPEKGRAPEGRETEAVQDHAASESGARDQADLQKVIKQPNTQTIKRGGPSFCVKNVAKRLIFAALLAFSDSFR